MKTNAKLKVAAREIWTKTKHGQWGPDDIQHYLETMAQPPTADEIELRRLRERVAELERERSLCTECGNLERDVIHTVAKHVRHHPFRPFVDPRDAEIERLLECDAAWRDLDSAIRRAVGADDGQPHDKATNEDCPLDCHHRPPETTLAAIQRAMKERLTNDACDSFIDRVRQPLQVIMSEGGNILVLATNQATDETFVECARIIIGNVTRASEEVSSLRMIRGTGAKS